MTTSGGDCKRGRRAVIRVGSKRDQDADPLPALKPGALERDDLRYLRKNEARAPRFLKFLSQSSDTKGDASRAWAGVSMELLAAIGGMSFIIASLVFGLRLLLLAQRTRELPEFAIGLALLLMGGLGYPLVGLARLATWMPETVRVGFFLVAILFNLIGCVAVCVFNWRVFRPAEAWARWLTVAFGSAALTALLFQSGTLGLRAAALRNEGIGLHAFMTLLGIPTAWAAFESLRYHELLARRAKLGLADPIVADRIWLWGLGMLLACVISVITSIFSLFGVDAAVSPAGALLMLPSVSLRPGRCGLPSSRLRPTSGAYWHARAPARWPSERIRRLRTHLRGARAGHVV